MKLTSSRLHRIIKSTIKEATEERVKIDRVDANFEYYGDLNKFAAAAQSHNLQCSGWKEDVTITGECVDVIAFLSKYAHKYK